jgi:hypothetical protein
MMSRKNSQLKLTPPPKIKLTQNSYGHLELADKNIKTAIITAFFIFRK